MDSYSYSIFVFACLLASVLSVPSPRHAYRSDYVYNPRTDAFYKLHPESEVRSRAETGCQAEGAKLMSSSSADDIIQVHSLMMKHDVGPLVWIGKEAKDSGCYVITKDMNINATKCTVQLPFVCKVTYAEANYVEECRAYGYHYYPETGSCYRVPLYATNWNKALFDCQKENAHLLVLNSKEEAETIKAFLKAIPPVSNAVNDLYFYAGFKADRPSREFQTIFGKTLEENGYVGWSENEPNNWSGEEYCGSVVRETGMNNDIVCGWNFGFICEKEVSSSRTTISTPKKNKSAVVTTRSTETNEVNRKMATQDSETNHSSYEIKTIQVSKTFAPLLV